MDWSGPVSMTIPADAPPFKRLVTFLGHYDFRVFLSPGTYVDIGAGSLPNVDRLRAVPEHKGLIGRIGRFCEMNESSQIYVHGDHDHEEPVNITFTALPAMVGGHQSGLSEFRPFTIGNGVVVSAGAIVLSGLTIGDAAVIGAGAVVTKDVEERSIVVGAPAREVRRRPAHAPWWDWSVDFILANRDNLQALARESAGRWREDRPRFCIQIDGPKLSFLGVCDGDRVAPITEAPAKVQQYVIQALKSETTYWLADCWS